MAPGSDDLVDVYHLYERVKGREGAQKDPKSTISADIELEITPKRVHKKVERLKNCYHQVAEAHAPMSNIVVPVCTLRVNRGGLTMKCCMPERCCVVLHPTLTGDA